MTSDVPVKDEMSMEELLAEAEAQSRPGALVTAHVVEVSPNGVLVDVGLKVEGVIPLAEFRGQAKPPQVGDSFPAIIKRMAGPEGHPLVSFKEARERSHWTKVLQARDTAQPLEATVTRQVKGGLIVDVGMEAFLPASQVERRPVKDLAPYVGQTFPVLVLEMDPVKGNVVVSRRRLQEKEAAVHRQETLKTIEVGAVRKGRVTSLTAFGAFIDIGGVEGLLRITDVSWGWVGKLSDVFKVGDEVEVKVLKFDAATGKIALGRKQLMPKPWDSVPEKYPAHSIQKGKVSSLTDFGAFVELEPGVEGLVHQSEFSWKERGVKPKEFLKIGQEVYVFVLSINKEQEKMALSLKRAGENPWVAVAKDHPAGSHVFGVVTHMLPVGAFVRLPSGIEGLMRTADLSWTKTPQHPKEVLTVGQEIEAVVLDVNPTTEKMALGLKQLTQDPYSKFSPGATVEGKVTRFSDQGAFVELAPDIEGFVHVSEIPADHRLSHPSEGLQVGQTVTALVLKGQPKSRRIDLSIRKHDQREERQLLKRYRPSGEGVTLGDVTEWGEAFAAAQEESPASDNPTQS